MSQDPCEPAACPAWPATVALVAWTLALAAFQSPNERFVRYIGHDSAVDLTMQALMRRGLRPAVDFGCVYGLLPLAINRAWYGALGLSPGAFRAEVVLVTCLTAWGMARFARALRVGPAGWALIALAMPDVLLPTTMTLVHVLEPALLVHALAEQARGRRGSALALATAACFVKPSMGFVYGACLLIAVASDARRAERAYWVRSLGPALATGAVLAAVLAAAFGAGPLARTIVPGAGVANYRLMHYGFFRGVGRDFWILPHAGLRDYFRYEVGVWLVGSAWLVANGAVCLWRLARGRSAGESARVDAIVVTCAALHAAFVAAFFGSRMSWAYYFAILVLGLAACAKGGRARVLVAACLAGMLLLNDASKLKATAGDWSSTSPSAETLGLWATPAERAEWREVLAITKDSRPALLTVIDGSVLLTPRFRPPVAGYFFPGLTLPVEAHRKAAQLASSSMVVAVAPRDWPGFTAWPELVAALDGFEPIFEGKTFRVYRRAGPGANHARAGEDPEAHGAPEAPAR